MISFRTKIAFVSAALLTVALVSFSRGSSSAEKTAARSHVVRIQGMVFTPKTLQIAPGDSITWTNDDIVTHAVKSTNAKDPWQSKDIPPHNSWTKVFTENASYLCPYHPPMTGEIAVAESKVAAP